MAGESDRRTGAIPGPFTEDAGVRRMEEGLRRSNRALRLITLCTEALIRASTEEALLSEVCRTMVEAGGYRMCWVGLAEHDARKTVRPVAHAGHDDGYLASVDIVWSDSPRGRGPTGAAIRTGRPVVGRDFTSDADLQQWREAALKRGYRSSTALPLSYAGERIGAIAMYSSKVESFDDEELDILLRLANDIAYGVHSLRQREVLRSTGEQLRLALEAGHIGTFDWDVPRNRISWSRWHEELWGFRPGEFGGTYEAFSGRVHPDDLPGINAEVARCIAARTPFIREFRVVWLDGSVHWIAGRGEFSFDGAGQAVRMRGAVLDITGRKQAEEASRASKQQLRDILDTMYAFVGLFTPEGVCLESNRAALEGGGLSREEVVGRQFADTPFWNHSQAVQARIREAIRRAAQGETVREDFEALMAGGVIVPVDVTFGPLRDASGRITHVVASGVEISKRKQAEEALRKSEEQLRTELIRLQAILAAQTDAVFVYGPGGAIVESNARGRELLGFDARGLSNQTVRERVRAKEGSVAARALAGEVVESAQISYTGADGQRRVGLVSAAPMRATDGSILGAVVMARDVTRRVREQEDLRALAKRLQTVREEEKSRIARDLHDDLGQALTALKMDLRWIERRVGDLPATDAVNALIDRTVAASALVDQTVATVQRVAAELRPVALTALGLGPALAEEGRRFQERTGIACVISLAEGFPKLADAAATTLYRIAQEALTNVARHAEARKVVVTLAVEGAQVLLRVEDDGRGFEPAGEPNHGLGLLGMRERAVAFGGDLTVERAAVEGTVVTACFPLSRVVAEAGAAP